MIERDLKEKLWQSTYFELNHNVQGVYSKAFVFQEISGEAYLSNAVQ